MKGNIITKSYHPVNHTEKDFLNIAGIYKGIGDFTSYTDLHSARSGIGSNDLSFVNPITGVNNEVYRVISTADYVKYRVRGENKFRARFFRTVGETGKMANFYRPIPWMAIYFVDGRIHLHGLNKRPSDGDMILNHRTLENGKFSGTEEIDVDASKCAKPKEVRWLVHNAFAIHTKLKDGRNALFIISMEKNGKMGHIHAYADGCEALITGAFLYHDGLESDVPFDLEMRRILKEI